MASSHWWKQLSTRRLLKKKFITNEFSVSQIEIGINWVTTRVYILLTSGSACFIPCRVWCTGSISRYGRIIGWALAQVVYYRINWTCRTARSLNESQKINITPTTTICCKKEYIDIYMSWHIRATSTPAPPFHFKLLLRSLRWPPPMHFRYFANHPPGCRLTCHTSVTLLSLTDYHLWTRSPAIVWRPHMNLSYWPTWRATILASN